MNYIVFDLEWNQSSTGEEQAPGLPFEILEIGAVKCNSQMEQIQSFHRLIRPQVYLQFHKVTDELLHLDMEELQKEASFCRVAQDFLNWCRGEEDQDFVFCSWGSQDLTEFQRNMKYYGMEPIANGPIPFLDVQKLFSIAYEDRKTRRALEYAVDYLHIEKDAAFHRADGDAYYTARVLEKCNDPAVLKYVSYDVFRPPVRREDEIKVQFDTYMKYISREFADKEEAFRDKEVISSKCYLCHRNLKKIIKWFSAGGKQYYCVAHCEKHGYLKGKIRVRKTDEDKVYVVKTTKFISEDEVEAIALRKDHAREMRRRHRASAKRRG